MEWLACKSLTYSQWAKSPKKIVWRSAFLLIRHSKYTLQQTAFSNYDNTPVGLKLRQGHFRNIFGGKIFSSLDNDIFCVMQRCALRKNVKNNNFHKICIALFQNTVYLPCDKLIQNIIQRESFYTELNGLKYQRIYKI